MKKWGYLLSGVVIGAMLMTSGSALAAQVKSMIGQKVTGEYTVIVNGKKLPEKGAIIDGKTNAPVRAISDAIGSKLDVDNKKKVINITTTETNDNQESNADNTLNNKYLGQPKSSLKNSKAVLQEKILAPTTARKALVEESLSKLKQSDPDLAKTAIEKAQEELDSLNADIAKYTEELRLVNEALEVLD